MTHAHPFIPTPRTPAPYYAASFETESAERADSEPFLREVLAYGPDAWYDPASVKICYEISFNRYFYKPKALRPLEEIRANLLAVDKEAEGLWNEIFGGHWI